MPSSKDPGLKNLFRIDIAARKGKHQTHGWQFKAVRDGKQQTKFFADGIFGSRELSLAAAKEYRDKTLELIGDYAGVLISDTLPTSNTSGILGVHRSESIRKDLSIEEVWQCNAPSLDGGRPRTKAFRISTYGERGALYRAVEARMEAIADLIGTDLYKSSEAAIRRLIDTYLDILVFLGSASDSEAEYVLSIVNRKDVEATEKQRQIAGRIGQATFKDKLVRLWRGSCAVTGASLLLNASHIKPWVVATDQERMDPFNGFLLSPVYDRAFDEGYISFENSGQILISTSLLPTLKQLSINPTAMVRGISELSWPYLEYHRSKVFRP